MKKVVMIFALTMMLATPMFAKVAEARENNAGAFAYDMSKSMPGTGEWYNNNFKGDFPWAECIIGRICCLVQLSSMFDAAAGKTNTGMRVDFWTSPNK